MVPIANKDEEISGNNEKRRKLYQHDILFLGFHRSIVRNSLLASLTSGNFRFVSPANACSSETKKARS